MANPTSTSQLESVKEERGPRRNESAAAFPNVLEQALRKA
jgi:hypothetical protein